MTEPVQRTVIKFNPHLRLRLGEWLAAAILTSLGSVLACYPNMFGNGSEYAVMELWAVQRVWAAGLLFLGITRLGALYVNGRRTITPYIRAFFAFLSCFVWWQFTLGFYLSGVPKTGWAIYPWLLALDAFNVFLATSDAREVYDRTRKRHDGTPQVS